MKKHRIEKLLLLAGVLTVLSSSHALAATTENFSSTIFSQSMIQPYWSEALNVNATLSVSGNTLKSEAQITAITSSNKITGTMYLQKYSNGRWVNVTSWKISGTGEVDLKRSYKGTSGVTYRTKVVVKVGTENIIEYSNEMDI